MEDPPPYSASVSDLHDNAAFGGSSSTDPPAGRPVSMISHTDHPIYEEITALQLPPDYEDVVRRPTTPRVQTDTGSRPLSDDVNGRVRLQTRYTRHGRRPVYGATAREFSRAAQSSRRHSFESSLDRDFRALAQHPRPGGIPRSGSYQCDSPPPPYSAVRHHGVATEIEVHRSRDGISVISDQVTSQVAHGHAVVVQVGDNRPSARAIHV